MAGYALRVLPRASQIICISNSATGCGLFLHSFDRFSTESLTSLEDKGRPIVSTLVDTQAIIQKWEAAFHVAERLFRNLENHRAKKGHQGFHIFRLDKAQGFLVTECLECGEELDRTRKTLDYQVESLARTIWNQMVHEAKIELKARLKAFEDA